MTIHSDKQLHIATWVLRIGVFGLFFGHGFFAIQGNVKWIPFLEIVGFSHKLASQILPIIGMLDILVAISVLIKPLRPILMWAVFWAFLTALMRPIAGGSIIDFVERAGNWATPMALLLILKRENNANIKNS